MLPWFRRASPGKLGILARAPSVSGSRSGPRVLARSGWGGRGHPRCRRDEMAPAIVYTPAREQQMIGPALPVSVAFTLRSNRTGTESFLREIRQAVAAVSPDLPIASITTIAALYNVSMARTSFSLVLLGIAGAMALLLGIVGIYGVLAYAVVQREREVGIRLALGARPGAVKQMFVYRGMILSCVGIAMGRLRRPESRGYCRLCCSA